MSLVASYNFNKWIWAIPTINTAWWYNQAFRNWTYEKVGQTIAIPAWWESLKDITFWLKRWQNVTWWNIWVSVYTWQWTWLVATSNIISCDTLVFAQDTTVYPVTFTFNNEAVVAWQTYYFMVESDRTSSPTTYLAIASSWYDSYPSGTPYRVTWWTWQDAIYDYYFTLNCNWIVSWQCNDAVQWLNGVASNITYVDWKENGAASFNGTTSQITVTHNAALNITNDITISCLLNLTDTPSSTYKGIIDKAYNTSYFFWIWSNTLWLGFFYGNTQVNTGVVLTVGKWHHVWVTYNRSTTTVKIFVDWVVVLTNASFNPTVSWNTSNVVIWRQQAAGYFLDGKIDALSIYNNTFTDADIKNDYLKYFWYYG